MQTQRGQKTRLWFFLLMVGGALAGLALLDLWAQTPQHAAGHQPTARQPIRMTMEELHRHGGVPPGWQLTLPEGDIKAGREAFVALQCYTCHTIAGEQFPPVKPEERAPAPDLAGHGALHPVAYIVEAILNPNAVVTDGPGFTDANGFSNMPSYLDLLTGRQLVDLVAYLQNLHPPAAMHHHGTDGHSHHPGASPHQEQTPRSPTK
jgi:mono/diheme cytochrome c family protein